MNRTTIGSVMRGMCYGFAALLFAASCANDNVTQDEKQNKDNIPAGATLLQAHPSQRQQHVQPSLTIQRAPVLP